jgi:ABC-type uncharacterized transport system permease subunit
VIPMAWVALVLFTGLFAGLLACLEIGYRIGRNRARKNSEVGFEGIGAMEAAIFSLVVCCLPSAFRALQLALKHADN